MGIRLGPEKRYLLEARLKRLLQREKIPSIKEVFQQIIEGNRHMFDILAGYVTTNHSFFFREAHHLEFLVENAHARGPEHQINIWCSACSSGEEPYSIAISLLEKNIDNFCIVASDISKKVLFQASRGVYTRERLSNLSPSILKRYFIPVGEGCQRIDERLRSRVRIKQLNLIEPLSFSQPFDYIFCRNVLMYFNRDGLRAATDNLIQNLKPNGYLFLGGTDIIGAETKHLKPIKTSVYQRIKD